MQQDQQFDSEDSGQILDQQVFESNPSLNQQDKKKHLDKSDLIKHLQKQKITQELLSIGQKQQNQGQPKQQIQEAQEHKLNQQNGKKEQLQQAQQRKILEYPQDLFLICQISSNIQQMLTEQDNQSKSKQAALFQLQPLLNDVKYFNEILQKYINCLTIIFKDKNNIKSLEEVLKQVQQAIQSYLNSNCCSKSKNYKRIQEISKLFDSWIKQIDKEGDQIQKNMIQQKSNIEQQPKNSLQPKENEEQENPLSQNVDKQKQQKQQTMPISQQKKDMQQKNQQNVIKQPQKKQKLGRQANDETNKNEDGPQLDQINSLIQQKQFEDLHKMLEEFEATQEEINQYKEELANAFYQLAKYFEEKF